MTAEAGANFVRGLVSSGGSQVQRGKPKEKVGENFVIGRSVTQIGIGQMMMSFRYSQLPDTLICTKKGIEDGVAVVLAGILSAVMSMRMKLFGPELPRNDDDQPTGLLEIDLRQNNIGIEGGRALAKALTHPHSTMKLVRLGRVSVSNTKLSVLDYANDVKAEMDFSNRDFHNGDATFVMRCIDFYSIKRLVALRLSNNWLTEIPSDLLGTLTSLEMFDVSYNNIRKLPASILNLRKTLKHIRRGGNLNMVEPPAELLDDTEKIMEYFDMKQQYDSICLHQEAEITNSPTKVPRRPARPSKRMKHGSKLVCADAPETGGGSPRKISNPGRIPCETNANNIVPGNPSKEDETLEPTLLATDLVTGASNGPVEKWCRSKKRNKNGKTAAHSGGGNGSNSFLPRILGGR